MPKLRDEPCPGTACGWRYPGFHICLNLPLNVMRQVETGGPPRATSEVRTESAEARALAAAERSAEMIRLYAEEGMTMRQVAEQLSASQTTVMNLLHSAAAAGDVVIRPRGVRSPARV